MTGASTCRRVVLVNYLHRTYSSQSLTAGRALNMPCELFDG